MFKQLFSRTRESREEAFWRWFSERADQYRAFTVDSPDRERLFNELSKALNRVCRGLQFEFGAGEDGAPAELVISADGIRDRIPAVQALVASAPDMPGWKVLAFRSRKPLSDIQLQVGAGTFDAEQLWYRLERDQGQISADIYISGLGEADQDAANFVGFMMLDCALGEYDVMTRVGALSFQAAPEDPAAHGLKRFDTLPEEFDAHYRLMHGG